MKKVISILLVIVMSCSALAVSAFADHKNGNGSGAMCNNTYYYVVHTQHIGVGIIGSHIHTDGRTCYITGLTMRHVKKCSSCHANVGEYIKTCEKQHSICGEFYKNCLEE